MGQKIPPVKGTRDVLPTDTYLKKDDPWVRTGHLHLIETARASCFRSTDIARRELPSWSAPRSSPAGSGK